MLVLTRKSDQSVMIGDEIEVTVGDVAGDKVRIAIRAPRAVPIFRKEIANLREQENASRRRRAFRLLSE